MESLPLYESFELRRITGPTIRPGGFALTERAVDVCGIHADDRVLDVGCGLGATVRRLDVTYGFKAIGVDTSFDLLDEGRSMDSSVSLMAGHADRLPFGNNRFDAVFCECVLSLLDDPHRALIEMGRVLKPEGCLIMSDLYARRPQGHVPLKDLPLNSCLKGARPRSEISGLVQEAGFSPVLWEDHSHLLKHLAARLVFEYGSMREFWSLFAPQCERSSLEDAIRLARPGYYLFISRKGGRNNG